MLNRAGAVAIKYDDYTAEEQASTDREVHGRTWICKGCFLAKIASRHAADILLGTSTWISHVN